MHGGFENETPNIPTNSIMKIDLVAHVEGNFHLLKKLENASSNNMNKSGGANANAKNNDSTSASGSSRATTPPMQSLAKANMKIRLGKGEIEQKKGQAPQVVNFAGSELKEKNAKNIE